MLQELSLPYYNDFMGIFCCTKFFIGDFFCKCEQSVSFMKKIISFVVFASSSSMQMWFLVSFQCTKKSVSLKITVLYNCRLSHLYWGNPLSKTSFPSILMLYQIYLFHNRKSVLDLSNFQSMFHFYTSWKDQRAVGFLMFSGV